MEGSLPCGTGWAPRATPDPIVFGLASVTCPRSCRKVHCKAQTASVGALNSQGPSFHFPPFTVVTADLLLGWVSALYLCAWDIVTHLHRYKGCWTTLFPFILHFLSEFALTLDLMHFQCELAFLTHYVEIFGHCSMVTWEMLVV